MRRCGPAIGIILLLPLLAACQPKAPVCPESTGAARYLEGPELVQALSATPPPFGTPQPVKIGAGMVLADKVVSGPLCNDHWRGTVYVACDVQVPKWQETPTFLEDCSLEIDPNTVIYVAAHDNAPYYQGCSCHTGEVVGP